MIDVRPAIIGKSILIFLCPDRHSFGYSRAKMANTAIGLTHATHDKTATHVRYAGAPTPGDWDASRAGRRARR
jgi:hypothetical protein